MQTRTNLRDFFDVVVMLTWSDWKTEPRSNRFHYASRFARELPVLFLQHGQSSHVDGSLRVEKAEIANLDLIHTAWDMSGEAVAAFRSLLLSRSLKRPLFWIYDILHYDRLLEAYQGAFHVIHATENYFISRKGGNEHGIGGEVVRNKFAQAARLADLVVAVSKGVADSIREEVAGAANIFVAENGVDADFFLDISRSEGSLPERPTAIFQGGINDRLDFALLGEVIRSMPDWDFWFCGKAEEGLRPWEKIRKLDNVFELGVLGPTELGRRMSMSTAGIIPFVDDEWVRTSLPLKAYEYVACGLPVVTTPIDALEKEPLLFSVARTGGDFEAALRSSIELRTRDDLSELRRQQAGEHSYDARSASVVDQILQTGVNLLAEPKRLNVLMLYDENSTHINTILDHLESFKKHSKHNTFYLTATGDWAASVGGEPVFDIDVFDVVIVHYTVRICFDWHMNGEIAELVTGFNGLKVLFIQDEYNTPEVARTTMQRLDFDLVYTCVPPAFVRDVYPLREFPKTEFITTLTGFVPTVSALEDLAMPIESREVRIAYRGRKLPYIYGSLGNEKYEIGLHVKRMAESRGTRTDIEVDDALRIYGADWFRFLGSARATLGTESGSNVFDFDGSARLAIEEMVRVDPDVTFDEVFSRVLEDRERDIAMNQISPKIFEAILMRTALILFEGEYSGIVSPNVHYLPLKKDYSNIDDIFAKLEDVEFLTEVTNRAYDDNIASGIYSYESFIEGVDRDIESRTLKGKNLEIFASPLFASTPDGTIKTLGPFSPNRFGLSSSILVRGVHRREAIVEGLAESFAASNPAIPEDGEPGPESHSPSADQEKVRSAFRETFGVEPDPSEDAERLRRRIAAAPKADKGAVATGETDLDRENGRSLLTPHADSIPTSRPSLIYRGLRSIWRLAPKSVRSLVGPKISRWSRPRSS